MKLRLPILILFLALIVAMACIQERADAQSIVWGTPIGNIGLNLEATEVLAGYDGILKQAIGGFSTPIYTDPKGIIALQVGAVTPWQTNGTTVQPYIAAGHDLAREIPILASYTSFHLNLFGRYDPAVGKAGAGVAASWAFAGGTLSPATSTIQTAPATSSTPAP